ncbi:MAG TPA: hypothetical protein DEG43_10190 [Acidimicrobiaceae bacterium]|nr:hypothetical protein [Acidimicrobiaceae bacterium]
MSEVMRTERDGISVFSTNEPGPLTVGLVLRAGECDESVELRGVGSLAQELVLSGLARNDGFLKASVGLECSAIQMTGDPRRVVDGFAQLNASIVQPRYEQIPHLSAQLRNLHKPDDLRTALGRSLAARVGTSGLGASGCPPRFLAAPDALQLHQWMTTHFGTANSVIWSSAPLPPEFSFRLPVGGSISVPEPSWVPGAYPGVLLAGESLCLTILDYWSPELVVAAHAARASFEAALFKQLGVPIQVELGLDLVNRNSLCHATFMFKSGPRVLGEVRDCAITEWRKMCWDGIAPEVLGAVAEGLLSMAPSMGLLGPSAAEAATSWLLGTTPINGEAIGQAARSMSPALASEYLEAAGAGSLWLAAPDLGWRDFRFHTVGVPEAALV